MEKNIDLNSSVISDVSQASASKNINDNDNNWLISEKKTNRKRNSNKSFFNSLKIDQINDIYNHDNVKIVKKLVDDKIKCLIILRGMK